MLLCGVLLWVWARVDGLLGFIDFIKRLP